MAARFLVRRARDLDRPTIIRTGRDKGLGRDDCRGKPALHVAGAAPIDAALAQFGAKWLDRPALAHGHDIGMAVEVDALPRPRPLAPRDDVPARMALAVARRPLGADHRDVKARAPQPPGKNLADVAIERPRRVQRRDAHQVLGQRDHLLAPRLDRLTEPVDLLHRTPALTRTRRQSISPRPPAQAARQPSRRPAPRPSRIRPRRKGATSCRTRSPAARRPRRPGIPLIDTRLSMSIPVTRRRMSRSRARA